MYEGSWDATLYSDNLRVHQHNVLLHGSVEALDLWDVLIPYVYVQLDQHVSKRCSGEIKIIILTELDNLEAPISIVVLDVIHQLHCQTCLRILLL